MTNEIEKTNKALSKSQEKENDEMTREQYSLAYDNGYPLTVRFLVSRGLSGESAEEAAQAAWAKGWEHRKNLRNPKRVVSWVNTIALNLFRNWFRRRESPEELPDIPITPKIDPKAIDLRRTLDGCDERDRELLEGHYLEGYTSEELGQKTGCTAVAVRVRLLRVRRKLVTALQPNSTKGERSKRNERYEQNSPQAFSPASKATKATNQPSPGLKSAA